MGPPRRELSSRDSRTPLDIRRSSWGTWFPDFSARPSTPICPRASSRTRASPDAPLFPRGVCPSWPGCPPSSRWTRSAAASSDKAFCPTTSTSDLGWICPPLERSSSRPSSSPRCRSSWRIGLLRTMVFTHVPSNVLLIAVAFAPTPLSAVSLLLCRQSLSQMDVPTRQSYVMSIVDEQDRTAAAGLTSATRTFSSSVSPSLTGYALANLWLRSPLVAAGALKLAYDLLIYRRFRRVRPPEEREVKAR